MKQKILIAILVSLIPASVLGFTDNTSTPTANNTPLPINTSATTQVKTGAFVTDSYLQGDVFYDRYNSGYYLQPRGTNRVNYVVADNQLTYGSNITNGEVQGAFFRDRNDGNFYVDPNGVSVLNDIRPAIIYDRNNTGYYVDPSGNSRVNAVYANDLYSYGYANVRNIYLRDVGRWASDIGRITTTVHTLPLTPSWQIRDVNAQYCALSNNPSWSFSFYDMDAVHCLTFPVGTNRWRIQAIGHDIDRGDVASCQYACINP